MSDVTRDFKRQAHALVEGLPLSATWDDLVRLARARRDLEEQEDFEDSGRVAEEVLREYEMIKAEIARVSPNEEEEW